MEKFIDIGIIVALEMERDALLEKIKVYKKIQDPSLSFRTYYLCYYNEYSIVITMLQRMGNLESLDTTIEVNRIWKPKYILLMGIAGGNSNKDIKIKDIIVSDSIFYYEIAKYTEDGIEIRSRNYNVSSLLLDRIQNITTKNNIHIGPIASGEKIVADKEFHKKVTSIQPNLLAFDMESAGVAKACENTDVGYISIRGVSDLADKKKSDRYRSQAMKNVANFFEKWISESPLERLSTSIVDLDGLYSDVKGYFIKTPQNKFSKEDNMIRKNIMSDYCKIAADYFKDLLPSHCLEQKITKVSIDKNLGIFELEKYNFDEFFKKIDSEGLIMILGHSGYGKTTLLRKKFINLKNERYPIWLEISKFLKLGPIRSVIEEISLKYVNNEKYDSLIEESIENGNFTIIIDDFNIKNIKDEEDKILKNLIDYFKYYIKRGNNIVVALRPFIDIIERFKDLFPSTYYINLPDKECVYDLLNNKYKSLLPTESIEKSVEILRIPILFSIYLSINKKTEVTKSNLLMLYINQEIERIDNTINKQKTKFIKNLIRYLSINMKYKKRDYFNSNDIIQNSKDIDNNLVKRLLNSSLFIPYHNGTFQFSHDYIKEYFIGLSIKDNFRQFFKNFLKDPKNWYMPIAFAIGIISGNSEEESSKYFNLILKQYDSSKELEYLYYSILCGLEIPFISKYEDKLCNRIVKSIEESRDREFYIWLPEIMNSVQMLKLENLNQFFMSYLIRKIKDNELTPRMLNLIHYSPQILIDSIELQNLFIEYLENIDKNNLDNFHMIFSIIEIFFITGIQKKLPIFELCTINNPILKAQLIYIMNSSDQKRIDFEKDIQKLKVEIEKFFFNSDVFIAGHSIYESIRLDCHYFRDKILKIFYERNDPVIKYHIFYGLRFAEQNCRESIIKEITRL